MNSQDLENRIREEAGEWVSVLTSPDVGHDKIEQFDSWYQEDPLHAQTYDRMAQTFELMNEIDDPELLRLADPDFQSAGIRQKIADWFYAVAISPMRQLPIGAVGGVAALFLFAAIAGLTSLNFSDVHQYSTETAEIRDIQLDDGSIVTLGAKSQIEVSYSDETRFVTLNSGQAYFSVEKDHSRPFIVQSNGTQIEVVGTKFNVHKGPAGLRVAVEEGVVAVSLHNGHSPEGNLSSNETERASASGDQSNNTVVESQIPKAVLEAGEQVVSSEAGGLSAVTESQSSGSPSAWREGQLIYSDARFAELVADIDRYYSGQITLASEAVGNMRISGVFWTTDITSVIDDLPQYLPVEVQSTGGDKLVVKLKPEATEIQ